MKLSDIRVDAAAIEAGDWVGDLPFEGMEGVRLKVRGTGNADYRRLQAKLVRKLTTKKLDDAQRDEEASRVGTELLIQTILVGWDGIFQEDGVTPIPYAPELAAQLLADPEMRVLRDAVLYAGNLVATRKKEARSDAEKN